MHSSPTVLETTEVSVYDLKDHPDFKFRPGSIVVRVADAGDSAIGAAGQVLDNHQTGKVIFFFFFSFFLFFFFSFFLFFFFSFSLFFFFSFFLSYSFIDEYVLKFKLHLR